MITISFGVLFLLAFVMSVEFGQTAAEIIRQGTRHGFKNAFLVSCGAFTAEIIFLLLTLTGLIVFFSDPQLLRFVWAFGSIMLFYLGLHGIINYLIGRSVGNQVDVSSPKWPFVTGFSINFLHPLNIVWWSGTLGPIVLESVHNYGIPTAALNGLGVPFGCLTWWMILSLFSSLSKKSFPVLLIKRINLFSSFALLLFGVYFLSKVFYS